MDYTAVSEKDSDIADYEFFGENPPETMTRRWR